MYGWCLLAAWKGNSHAWFASTIDMFVVVVVVVEVVVVAVWPFSGLSESDADAVSYTHLTLPTIYSV